jgi:hypothetical protein
MRPRLVPQASGPYIKRARPAGRPGKKDSAASRDTQSVTSHPVTSHPVTRRNGKIRNQSRKTSPE